ATNQGVFLSDTWEWNGTTWTQQPISGPSPRYLHSMAYDSALCRTMLFGGIVPPNPTLNGETWSLDSPCSSAPFITQQPVSRNAMPGQAVSFSVAATGSPPLEYQWRKDGQPLVNDAHLTGVATATLTIDPVSPADAGSYDVVVSNSFGSTTSVIATLTE